MDDFLIDILDHAVTPLLLAGGLFVTVHTLILPERIAGLARLILLLTIVWYGATSILHGIEFWARRKFSHAAYVQIRVASKIILWTVAALLIIDNLGYDITSLLAGLGIAGIAVGLALQGVLRDLFSYICILVDKPFVVGDFLIIGADMGTIEYIGLRTTRVRTLRGEDLIVPNTDLTSTRINNFKKMATRRVEFTIGVVYGTPAEQLARVPELIREAIDGVDDVRLDRAHFASYGASSLDIEIVYIIGSGDHNFYMDRRQRINLRIYEIFERENIDFAFPTRTIHMAAP